MNMKTDQIMVDIETTGTDGSHAAMIQLSAVAFNLETQEVNPVTFDQCLLMPRNRFWSEDTRDWWASLPPHVLETVWNRMRDPKTVLLEFYHWVKEVSAEGGNPVLWAKPVSFEWPFLQSYFEAYDVPIPFFYSDSQDLRSWCRSRGQPLLDRELPFNGTEHNALHDVLHQVNVLFTLNDQSAVIDPTSIPEGVQLLKPNGEPLNV
jgi:hypothetical protein